LRAEGLRIGCSGWSYKDWQGPFYPRELQPKEFLGFYSKVFDCVEIDSSFYRVPNAFMIAQWSRNTPAGFLFSPKLPKKITHEKKLRDSESQLMYFYSALNKLGPKLGPIAVQLPPSFKLSTDLQALKTFLGTIDPKFDHAIEFRHKSWFTPETYALLRDHGVSMVWTLNQYVETPPEPTSALLYLRLVGDREITEFTGTQRDRSVETKRWASAVSERLDSFERGFVFFNNHFAGFSPESANEFRRLLGLMELDWKRGGSGQQTLFGS
jgi:uncharacterized protein YecE (DUF72 family)